LQIEYNFHAAWRLSHDPLDLFWRRELHRSRNVAAAAWYVEELGLRTMNIEMDNGGSCIALGFSKDEHAVTLGPPGG
jgi:hypothetical protein